MDSSAGGRPGTSRRSTRGAGPGRHRGKFSSRGRSRAEHHSTIEKPQKTAAQKPAVLQPFSRVGGTAALAPPIQSHRNVRRHLPNLRLLTSKPHNSLCSLSKGSRQSRTCLEQRATFSALTPLPRELL